MPVAASKLVKFEGREVRVAQLRAIELGKYVHELPHVQDISMYTNINSVKCLSQNATVIVVGNCNRLLELLPALY
jgi:hypothetical protein